MPRKKIVLPKRELSDPRFANRIVAKFITRMMIHGQKVTSTNILYGAIDFASQKAGREPLEVFLKALENVKPVVEVKSRRVGGSTYQVPVEIRESRREALAMRWIIDAARKRSGKPMSDRLAVEILDAFNQTGTAFKKKEDTHRMAEANKAFSHYRW